MESLSPVWVFPREGTIAPVASSPTVYGGVVYVGDDEGRLYALHATGPSAGTLLPGFPIQLDGAVKGRPAVYGDRGLERVYVATAGGLFYGRTVETRLAGEQHVQPSRTQMEVEDASGFFPAGRIRLVTSGPLGDQVITTYTYSALNTAARPHRLLNLSPVGDGYPLATHPKGSVVLGTGPGISCNLSPAVPGSDDATLVITALENTAPASRFAPADSNLVALKSESYGLLPQWEAVCGVSVTTAPLVNEARGLLYIGSRDESGNGRLHALHASNGLPSARWPDGGALALRGALEAGPWHDAARGRLYFGTTTGFLYAVGAEDGAFVFPPMRLAGAGGFHATPVVAGGRLYLGSHTGRFYSVSLSDPSRVKAYASPDASPLDTSPSASGGAPGVDVVVIGSSAGKVLAFPVE